MNSRRMEENGKGKRPNEDRSGSKTEDIQAPNVHGHKSRASTIRIIVTRQEVD